MLSPISEALISVAILVGAFFTLVGSIGLSKLPDFFLRLHGPTKSTTLGLGGLLLGAWLWSGFVQGDWWPRGLLVTFFLFMTAPVSAHMLAKAGLHHKLGHRSGVPESTSSADEPQDPT